MYQTVLHNPLYPNNGNTAENTILGITISHMSVFPTTENTSYVDNIHTKAIIIFITIGKLLLNNKAIKTNSPPMIPDSVRVNIYTPPNRLCLALYSIIALSKSSV